MTKHETKTAIGVSSAVLGCIVAAVIGCKSQPDPNQTAGTQTAQGVAYPPAAAANPFMASVERAQPYYAKGYNALTSVVERMIDDYDRAVGDINAPRAIKPTFINLSMIDDRNLEEAATSFSEGKKVAPPGNTQLSDPADKAVVYARAIAKDYKDASVYYSAEKYKDDQGAGGREIHVRITADIAAYKASISMLDEQLKVIEQKQALEELRIHNDPTTYGHQFRAFNITATAFMNADDKPGVLDRAYSDLDTAYKKVKAFADGKGAAIHPTFGGYMTQVDNLYTQVTVVQRDVREKVDETKMNRDFDLLVSRYNSLIQLTNALYDIEGSGIIK